MHRIVVSCRINRLWHLDRAIGEPVRRYEADRPGDLVHIDVKKLGNLPDDGYCYVHCAVDSHSRLAYSEALDDETAAIAFLDRAATYFAGHGIDHIQRILTDNGAA